MILFKSTLGETSGRNEEPTSRKKQHLRTLEYGDLALSSLEIHHIDENQRII